MALKIFEIDPSLRGCEGQIWDRVNGYRPGHSFEAMSIASRWWKKELGEKEDGIESFAEGYKIFGFNRTEGPVANRKSILELLKVLKLLKVLG